MRLGLFDRVATSLFARVGPPMTGLSAPGLPPRVPISGPFGLSVRDILGTLLRPFTLRVVCAAALACIFFAFDFFTPAPIRHLRQPRMRTPRPMRRRPARAALRAGTDAAVSRGFTVEGRKEPPSRFSAAGPHPSRRRRDHGVRVGDPFPWGWELPGGVTGTCDEGRNAAHVTSMAASGNGDP